MKAMIKVGRWANEHKQAAAVILDRQTFYRDAEDTYQGIKHVDMVPNLSPQNLACVEIGKNFMLSHGYIKNDFDVHEVGRAGVPRAGGEGADRGRVEESASKASGELPETRVAGGSPDDMVNRRQDPRVTRRDALLTAGKTAAGAALTRCATTPAPETGSTAPAHRLDPKPKPTTPGALCDAPGGLRDVEGRARPRPHPRRSHLRGVHLRRPRGDGQEHPPGLSEVRPGQAPHARAGRRDAPGSPIPSSSPR